MQPPLRFHASDRVSDGVSDRVCRALFHARCRVDVGAERESCAEVTQRFRQCSHVHAAFQRQGGKCVSHVMKSRVYLKTVNAPGQRAFSRCAASFFLEIRQYSCEKMSCSARKFLAAGHITSFHIHPDHYINFFLFVQANFLAVLPVDC